MQKQKITFAGNPDLAVPALRAVAAMPEYEIIGVLTAPDRPVGRKQVLNPPPVAVAAQELQLLRVSIANKKELREWVAQNPADLGLVIAFGVIFPADILAAHPWVNVHFSLLPQWRGASPVQAAIAAGQTTSGITLQNMVLALDAGDVLHQETTDIAGLTTPESFERMGQQTAAALPGFLQKYFSGSIRPQPQNDAHATYCTLLHRNDGAVHPTTHTAQEIERMVRAYTPYPGVHIAVDANTHIKLLQVALHPNEHSVQLLCKDNTVLYISQAQRSGKPATNDPQALAVLLQSVPPSPIVPNS